MFIKQSYKNPQSARVALQRKLNELGFKLADVEYEIKSIRNSGRFHPVVAESNGKHLCRSLMAAGFVVSK